MSASTRPGAGRSAGDRGNVEGGDGDVGVLGEEGVEEEDEEKEVESVNRMVGKSSAGASQRK
jgi:hypothetical protein